MKPPSREERLNQRLINKVSDFDHRSKTSKLYYSQTTNNNRKGAYDSNSEDDVSNGE
jgi:hypothetical protein